MNRERKYRIWDKQTKTFTFVEFGDICAWAKLPDCVVQDFIGFKDNKRKAIYEGDIIQLENAPYLYEVVWNKWQWGVDSKNVVTDFVQGFTAAIQNRAIVVGNVFENPDMIKS